MPSHPAIPPLLFPYLDPPSSSLTLLTSTLGFTNSWLVLRFIHAAFKQHGLGSSSTHEAVRESKVVLVSWLRDRNFWKDGGRKLCISLEQVNIIDALTQNLDLGPDCLHRVEATILEAINEATEATKGSGKIFLVLDGLDFLFAATGCPVLEILDMIGEFREACSHSIFPILPPISNANSPKQSVHSMIVTSCADLALIQPPSHPLETSHVAFVMSMAHQARLIMGVKRLDTGFAKDVSGVLRLHRGPEVESTGSDVEENEYLYFVEADGGVRVFERGT